MSRPSASAPRGAVGGDGAPQLLFNTDAFHRFNITADQRIVTVHGWDGDRHIGSLSGVVDGDVFCSGHSAPFGGPDIDRADEHVGPVVELMRQALAQLAELGVQTVRVRARPLSHGPVEAHVQFALCRLGFAVETCDLNYAIDVSRFAGPDDYVASLKSDFRRKLRRAREQPFTVGEAGDDAGEWALGYGLIERNHRAKGYPVRLPLEYLLRAQETFPGRISMVLLRHAGTPCAATVVYRVSEGIDLLVYWGDADHDLRRSVMLPFTHRLVERSLRTGARLFDLGIASEEGAPNPGLAFFKQRLGARPEPRFVFVRHLDGSAP